MIKKITTALTILQLANDFKNNNHEAKVTSLLEDIRRLKKSNANNTNNVSIDEDVVVE